MAAICAVTALAAVFVRMTSHGTAGAATSTSIVISQVYGGGGNVNATFRHDFIVRFNLSNSTVDVSKWSVQYAAATSALPNKRRREYLPIGVENYPVAETSYPLI